MPIKECDPWRMQYFDNVSCPEDVLIPTEDSDAWRMFPQYRWIYNKLQVAESQGFETGLHGMDPLAFPVFSKPVYNMRGMGTGSRVLKTPGEYRRYLRPGHFWMPLLQGEHVSSDAAVVEGETKWWRHVIGKPLEGGIFDYWTVLEEGRPDIESYCADWIRKNLAEYTGMINVETIGARIIEVHLRFADQWPDLYGAGWLEALVRLYTHGVWQYDDNDRRTGYSVVLFGEHGIEYHPPDESVVEELLAQPEISSVQITFHPDKPLWAHAMPPGGFRLAIVNCWTLDEGMKARQRLAVSFWSAQRLLRRRPRSNSKPGNVG